MDLVKKLDPLWMILVMLVSLNAAIGVLFDTDIVNKVLGTLKEMKEKEQEIPLYMYNKIVDNLLMKKKKKGLQVNPHNPIWLKYKIKSSAQNNKNHCWSNRK